MVDLFVKLPLSVLEITKISSGDKPIPFTLADKVVYSYFFMKISHYCWKLKGEYFDTQEDIAEILGTDVQVVRRSITKLIDQGILSAKKIRYKGRWKWIYTDIQTLQTKEKLPKEPVVNFLNDELGW